MSIYIYKNKGTRERNTSSAVASMTNKMAAPMAQSFKIIQETVNSKLLRKRNYNPSTSSFVPEDSEQRGRKRYTCMCLDLCIHICV
jgi:hypothetical protein